MRKGNENSSRPSSMQRCGEHFLARSTPDTTISALPQRPTASESANVQHQQQVRLFQHRGLQLAPWILLHITLSSLDLCRAFARELESSSSSYLLFFLDTCSIPSRPHTRKLRLPNRAMSLGQAQGARERRSIFVPTPSRFRSILRASLPID